MHKRIFYLAGLFFLALGLLAGLVWARTLQVDTPSTSVAPQAQTVVAAGDISCNTDEPKSDFTCRSTDTAALVQSLQPDAVLAAGDIQYLSGEPTAYATAYDKTWGAFKDITYPVPGNHDYLTTGATGYYDYFGQRAGERDKGYYSFALGSWRFYALNSEIDMSANSPQLIWLKQDLESNPSTCTLAYWHKPRFSTGYHKDDPAFDSLWRLLYEHNVDVVVNGHSHDYERFLAQNPDKQPDPDRGITEFVSGMGGYSSETLREPTATLATRQNHAFGVLQFTLHDTSLDYTFVPIDSSQTFHDNGAVTCH